MACQYALSQQVNITIYRMACQYALSQQVDIPIYRVAFWKAD